MTKPSIVFVHGLWADGSCFNKVIPALQAGPPTRRFPGGGPAPGTGGTR